ncbi:ABC transporter permease subunit [Bosea sp. (in: a-proteobacteria)]|uniref:branched-chain amino acid ABC transporter ATP-binding protein/permease n=1 Tax=Bosea sp. (in: a-proteobacteria) TaxID=1871050 RepID=UPI003B3A3A19
MPVRTAWILAATVVAIVITPHVLSNFYIAQLNFIGIYAIVAIGLVILTGSGGLTSFGQSAFVGLGAYATAVLSAKLGFSPWAGLPVAVLLSALCALILGMVTLHLSGHYLALVTLAWGMVITLLFGNIEELGAHTGISDIPPVSFFGVSLAPQERYFYLVATCLAGVMIGTTWLLQSRQGRAIRALRGGRTLVTSLGIDEFRIRLGIFIVAALLAGLSGWLYAHSQRYVGPDPFSVQTSIEFLLMAVIGGAGHIVGAVIGATLFTTLHAALQDILPLFTTRAGNIEKIVYGCLFILVLQHARSGIVGLMPRLRRTKLRHEQSSVEPLPRRTLPPAGERLLQVSGLTKRFGGLTAVDNVSFEIRAGEIIGMIGPNGAGKSTTFNLISGALRPTQGTVTFIGRNLTAEKPLNLIKVGVARTFQHVKLRPNMSLLENVMLGAYSRTRTGFVSGALHLDMQSESQVRAEALEQLRRIGLIDRAHDLVGNLPLGQQRAVEIARALASDPIILLLDEPAAGLRRLEKDELSSLLKEVSAAGVTLLLIEHDMEFVMGLVDRIIMLDFGKQRAMGTPEEIRANPIVREAYLGAAL